MLSKSLSSNKLIFVFILLIFALTGCNNFQLKIKTFSKTHTFAGFNREFGEPFGVAVDKNGNVYVSDGEAGKIFRISADGKPEIVTDKLNTPSAIALDKDQNLIIADSGKNTINLLNLTSGELKVIAGTENKRGFDDGENSMALFNAPIGLALSNDGKIYVADTYNDKIRLIENGKVTTVAGSSRGFADGSGAEAKFDTPCGLTIMPDQSLLVADTGNKRLRRIESNGRVTTVAGTGEQDSFDGFPLQAKFVEPTALAIDTHGTVYVTDGNSIRAIGRRTLPFVETISGTKRAFADGTLRESQFNRPSGMAFDAKGNLFVADAENQVVRVLTGDNIGKIIQPEEKARLRFTAEEFRQLQPPRWTFNPPDVKRDIAGTLGEVRGNYKTDDEQIWFHNGLDIAGSYGEKAYFIRSEKVLQPIATENFGGLRELLRMPTIGYIHLRLGRDKDDKQFGDERFQFTKEDEKIVSVRIPRGKKFLAGDAIGTLNSFNHVHLIAGRPNAEMNALDALIFPDISDKIPPKIEKVSLYTENWTPLETERKSERIKLEGKIRITVQAYDRMDGNPERRKLGVYKLGYQILGEDKTPIDEQKWTISFEKMPDMDFVKLAYAKGSKSGYTPETIFDYVISNEVLGVNGKENFLDLTKFQKGKYILRVIVADFFGNTANEDILFEVS